jgi:hypothetical protein
MLCDLRFILRVFAHFSSLLTKGKTMNDYHVPALPEDLRDLGKLADWAGVQLAPKDLKIGQALLELNPIPEQWPSVVTVYKADYDSSIRRLLEVEAHTFGGVPVHPMALFVLAAGMHDPSRNRSIEEHLELSPAVSPCLLHRDDENYLFVLCHSGNQFTGRFHPLSNGIGLPHCMHIWGYAPGKEPKGKMFRINGNRKYSDHYS